MSLPSAWTDKIFKKLTLAYGRDFIGRWEGIDLNDVKSDWAHELSGFEAHPEAIAWSLENLPESPPNAIKFRNLCRQAPAPDVPQLPQPKADPERVAAELAKLAPMRVAASMQTNGKDWARRILARDEAGEKIRPYTLTSARQTLGLEGRMSWH